MLRAARREAQKASEHPPAPGFNFGLNVWAKMEECRPWPGRVIRKRKPTVQHRDHVAVMFYGEEDEFAWIKEDHIVPLTMDNLREFCRDCPDEPGGFALSVRQGYVDFCHGCPLPECRLCFYERHAAMEHVRLCHKGLECTADDYFLAAVRRRAELETVVRFKFALPIQSVLISDDERDLEFPKLDPKTCAWFEAILEYAFAVPDNEQLPPPDQSTYSTSDDDSEAPKPTKKRPPPKLRPDNGGQPREKLKPMCRQNECGRMFASHQLLYDHLIEMHKLGTPLDQLVVTAPVEVEEEAIDEPAEEPPLEAGTPDKLRYGASRMVDSLAFFASYDVKPRSPPESSFTRLPKVSELPSDLSKLQEDKPRPAMRIGSDFQAVVPVGTVKDARGDLVKGAGPRARYGEEMQVWKPNEQLEQLENFEDSMEFAKLRGIKGRGGEKWKHSDMEYMYHIMHKCHSENKKDTRPIITRAMVQFTDPKRPATFPCLKGYHYEGSNTWTPEEIKMFKKGYEEYGKQFHVIQPMVKTKTQAECVEFYYRDFKLDPEYTQLKQLLKRRQQEEEERNQTYGVVVACDHCGIENTPRWRIGPNDEDWCDTCFMYWRDHKKIRPIPKRGNGDAKVTKKRKTSGDKPAASNGGGGGGGGGGKLSVPKTQAATVVKAQAVAKAQTKTAAAKGAAKPKSAASRPKSPRPRAQTAAKKAASSATTDKPNGSAGGKPPSTPNDKGGSHECEICHKKFLLPNSLYGHMRVHSTPEQHSNAV